MTEEKWIKLSDDKKERAKQLISALNRSLDSLSDNLTIKWINTWRLELFKLLEDESYTDIEDVDHLFNAQDKIDKKVKTIFKELPSRVSAE